MDDWRPFVGDNLCGLFSHGAIRTASSQLFVELTERWHLSAASHLLGVTNSVRRCAGRNEELSTPSSCASRFRAGAFGFFDLSQSGERPDR
jgi:hypothetical protein